MAMPFFEFLGGNSETIKSPSAILFLFFSSVVSAFVVAISVDFILTAICDMMRLITIGEVLNDMVRITDLTTETVFAIGADRSKVVANLKGMTKSYMSTARTPQKEKVIRNSIIRRAQEALVFQDLKSFYIVQEDSEVILPRLPYRYIENFMTWTHIRLLMKQLGTRYRQRLDIFVSK